MLEASVSECRTDNAVKNRWAALCKKEPQLERSTAQVEAVACSRGEMECSRVFKVCGWMDCLLADWVELIHEANL